MKKFFCILTIVCMVMVFIPCMAFATEAIIVDGKYLTSEEADRYIIKNKLPSDAYDLYMSNAVSTQSNDAATVITSAKKDSVKVDNKNNNKKNSNVTVKKNETKYDKKDKSKDSTKLPKAGAGIALIEWAYLISAIGGFMLIIAIIVKRASIAVGKKLK